MALLKHQDQERNDKQEKTHAWELRKGRESEELLTWPPSPQVMNAQIAKIEEKKRGLFATEDRHRRKRKRKAVVVYSDVCQRSVHYALPHVHPPLHEQKMERKWRRRERKNKTCNLSVARNRRKNTIKGPFDTRSFWKSSCFSFWGCVFWVTKITHERRNGRDHRKKKTGNKQDMRVFLLLLPVLLLLWVFLTTWQSRYKKKRSWKQRASNKKRGWENKRKPPSAKLRKQGFFKEKEKKSRFEFQDIFVCHTNTQRGKKTNSKSIVKRVGSSSRKETDEGSAQVWHTVTPHPATSMRSRGALCSLNASKPRNHVVQHAVVVLLWIARFNTAGFRLLRETQKITKGKVIFFLLLFFVTKQW